jgi:U3 small nucleolar RNA-associated protein 7
MDSLMAKADAIQPYKKRKTSHPPSKSGSSKPKKADQTSNSIAKRTKVPKSLQGIRELPKDDNYKHIANKKLRTHLNRQFAQGARAQALVDDAEMLLMDDAGGMQVESEMDRTWRVGQTEIVHSAGQEAAKGRKEYKLDGGPYRSRYTRNGRYICTLSSNDSVLSFFFRHLAIVGRTGHVSTFDWQTGTMHSELQLQETCRDIT